MPLGHHYWRRIFKGRFRRELDAIVEALETRVLPGFSGIELEAERASDDAWNAFMLAPATGDEVPSEFAEAAENIGVERYLLLVGVRQGIVNLFAAGLFHTFEQQFILFGRQEILDFHTEKDDPQFMKLEVIRGRLRARGVDIEQFSCWPWIEELRLLANTVKHAEGRSATELHARRPDLFKAPGLPGLGEWGRGKPNVYQPLLGEDIYVSVEDVRQFRDELVNFWDDLCVAIAKL